MYQFTIGVARNQALRYPAGPRPLSADRPFHVATALGAPIAYFFAADDEGELTCLEAGNDD
jgi:transcriptional regulator with XRE-family HTH domain